MLCKRGCLNVFFPSVVAQFENLGKKLVAGIDPDNVEDIIHQETMDSTMLVSRQLKLPRLFPSKLGVEVREPGFFGNIASLHSSLRGYGTGGKARTRALSRRVRS